MLTLIVACAVIWGGARDCYLAWSIVGDVFTIIPLALFFCEVLEKRRE